MESQTEKSPRVLVVGGSDPSGAAGIQADLKALAALGIYGAAAITAVTAQNSRSFADRVVLPASVVKSQIELAYADLQPQVVKTGMLANEDIVGVLIEQSESWGGSVSLVLDPVITSTTGKRLLDEAGLVLFAKELLPRAALITPNIAEASLLSGVAIVDLEGMRQAADCFLAAGAGAVLIKGGHLEVEEDELVDLLRTADGGEVLLRHAPQRLATRAAAPASDHFRGTGCILASLIAAGLAEGKTLQSAVEDADAHLQSALTSPLLGLNAGLIQPGLSSAASSAL